MAGVRRNAVSSSIHVDQLKANVRLQPKWVKEKSTHHPYASSRFPATAPSPQHSSHTSELTQKSDLSQFKQMQTWSLAVCILECFRSFKINFGSKQIWNFFFIHPEVSSTEFFTCLRFAAVSKLKQLEGCTTGRDCELMHD